VVKRKKLCYHISFDKGAEVESITAVSLHHFHWYKIRPVSYKNIQYDLSFRRLKLNKKEWWIDFFSGPSSYVQQKVKSKEETRAEADYIRNLLRPLKKAKILDVPCGNGRLSLEFASCGYELTGVDVTRSLIEVAKETASKVGAKISYECMDMRKLPWQEEFDAAFCFWGSFGYFDDEGNMEFLNAVSQALRPGGRFLLETQTLETVLPNFRERLWRQVDDVFILETGFYNPVNSTIEAEVTFIRNGKTTKYPITTRFYTYQELCKMFERAGLVNCDGYESMTMNPFRLGAKRLTLVGTKR